MEKILPIGTIVWCKPKYSGIVKAEIISDILTDTSGKKELKYYRLHGISTVGEFGILVSEVFESKKELEAYLNAEYCRKVNGYKGKINSVEDLVSFMYDKMQDAGEYTNSYALKACKDKAKELLDLDIE